MHTNGFLKSVPTFALHVYTVYVVFNTYPPTTETSTPTNELLNCIYGL